MAHSTRRTKPEKPRKDFPLTPHPGGYWCKKVRGKLHYFGKWGDDSKGKRALEQWLAEKDDLLAGRLPRTTSKDGPTLGELCSKFIIAKEKQRDAGDIRPDTYDDYEATCETVLRAFGKQRLVDDLAADDFQSLRATLAKRLGPHALSREVQQVRTLFKYGFDAGLLDKPVRFGPTFKRPSKRIMRAHRQQQQQKNGKRMFERHQLWQLIYNADQPLKAMILLAINCGFGNTDCGRLPKTALDLDKGWVEFPRPKTAIERRCPLWPETVVAVRDALADRPKAKQREHDGLVFVTKYGQPWAKDTPDNPVTKEFRKLLDTLGLYRRGLGFYALRHTFETIGGNSRDQVAVDYIMGHADESIAALYREGVFDERLRDVVNHVHAWLFPHPTAG